MSSTPIEGTPTTPSLLLEAETSGLEPQTTAGLSQQKSPKIQLKMHVWHFGCNKTGLVQHLEAL